MASNTIDAKIFAKMFLAGAKNLESRKEWINELNVFPVPDGDTGTNMTMTIMSAAREVTALGEDLTMDKLSKAISGGSLRGARGNSGVILSQLFRGFTKRIKSEETLNVEVLTEALDKAVESAYKAVMVPKEGTILTVARGCAEKARELFDSGETDIEVFLGAVLEHARLVLSQTPELLPVLKQAGVVDSGGQGLVEVLSGAYDAFLGKEVDLDFSKESPQKQAPGSIGAATDAAEEIRYGYCTEFIIMLGGKPFNVKQEMDFKAYLESIGDSIVCVADDDLVKVHVHTNDPGLAIQKALKYGALCNMKIDNMRLEHQEKLFKEASAGGDEAAARATAASAPSSSSVYEQIADMELLPDAPATGHKAVGFVAISVGEGFAEIFRSLGVDSVIEGGQTMNPSTADILDAVEKVDADTVFVLPNNKNIIMAANQASELMTDKDLFVIPTRTIPQGITAVINYVQEISVEENEETMLSEIGTVKTGQVTYAIRDTEIDGKVIHQGDFMGIGDEGILSAGQNLHEVATKMVAQMTDETSELISIYFGADVTEEDAKKLQEEIADVCPSCDIELQNGGQPVYYYIVSVE